MDDRSPPKKKSRFFSGGKNSIGTITHSPEQRDDRQHSAQLDDESSTLPPIAGEGSTDPSPQDTSQQSNSVPPTPSNTIPVTDMHSNLFPKGTIVSEAGKDITNNIKSQGFPNDQVSGAASAFRSLLVRDNRRDGIYGAESLLLKKSDARDTNTSNRPSIFGGPIQQMDSPKMPVQQEQFSSLPQKQFTFQAPQPNNAFGMSNTFQTSVQPQLLQCQIAAQNGAIAAAQDSLPPMIPQVAQQPHLHQPLGSQGDVNDGNVSLSQMKSNQSDQPSNLLGQKSANTHIKVQTVDLDRDHRGRLLPMAKVKPGGITKFHSGCLLASTDSMTGPLPMPANIYIAPNRIPNALTAARQALKRKRSMPVLPPPAYIYTRSNDPNFNIFSAILLYPELCFALASHLTVNSLVNLYAISKDFHTIIDSRFTTVVLSQAENKAPESSRTFGFRSYAQLCRTDPAARIPHPYPSLAAKKVPRRIPSFRWLKMVLHREKVVHELMAVFAEDGIPLPARCSLALKRMWFMFDIPDNARRIGYIHLRQLFTDLDLYFAMCFFVKMDMRLNDPVAIEKRDGLRKMLLSQRSLTTILMVLKREIWRDQYEVMQAWLRYRYEHVVTEEENLSILGVPPNQLGKLKYEYWGLRKVHSDGKPVTLLLRPDQLVMREAIRRGLRFHKHFLRCLLYGYIRPDTLEDYAPRNYGRRIEDLKDEEYGVNDIVGGVGALKVEEGGDPYLDLGQPIEGSPYTIVKEEISEDEKKQRKLQNEFLDLCIDFAKREMQDVQSDEASGENDHVNTNTDDLDMDSEL